MVIVSLPVRRTKVANKLIYGKNIQTVQKSKAQESSLFVKIFQASGKNKMCIICLQFQKDKDLVDARRMLEAAKRELHVIDIDSQHLREIELVLDYKEKIERSKNERR